MTLFVCVNLFHKYLLNIYYVLNTLLSSKEAARHRPCSCFEEAECLMAEKVSHRSLITVLCLVKFFHSFSKESHF